MTSDGSIEVGNVLKFGGLTLDEILQKAKDEGVSGGGGSTASAEIEMPSKSSLIVGRTVSFAGYSWIVSHKTSSEAYLTLSGIDGCATGFDLASKCMVWAAANIPEATRIKYLKPKIAGITSGYVFVATKDQMDGGFSYFRTTSNRIVTSTQYWTSTSPDGSGYVNSLHIVDADGSTDNSVDIENVIHYYSTAFHGFRPSLCINLSSYT